MRWPFGPRLLMVVLLAATAALYARTLGFELLVLDDNRYLSPPELHRGLGLQSALWAFTATDVSNWHPLTWLSYLLDLHLYGDSAAAGLHATNALLHVANVGLLYAVLRRLTGAAGPSLLAAALFSLHPLRVESVAWVSERKDVLCGLFWLLSLLAYAGWARAPSVRKGLAVAATFAAALLAKPMAVTLPAVLLLLDFWPLERNRRSSPGALAVEKLPLLALSAASALVTLWVHARAQTLVGLERVARADRLWNAPLACVGYPWSWLWPTGLSPN